MEVNWKWEIMSNMMDIGVDSLSAFMAVSVSSLTKEVGHMISLHAGICSGLPMIG